MTLNFILVAIVITTVIALGILSTKYDRKAPNTNEDFIYLRKVDKAIEILMFVFVLSLCGLIITQFI